MMSRHGRTRSRGSAANFATFAACAVLLALLAQAAGCEKGPARECDSRVPCAPPLVCDLGSNVCVEEPGSQLCSAAADCGDPTAPFCATEINKCVACLVDGANDECAGRKICDKYNCLPCQEDTQCDSSLCLLDGGCAEIPQVAFVTETGTVNTTCSDTQPCTLPAALATGRRYVRLRGALSVSAAVTINRTVSILGPRAARASVARTTAGPIFDISGDGAVELANFELRDAIGATGDAIKVSAGAPTLSLRAVDLINNAGVGVASGSARLTVTRSLIVGNRGGGVAAAGVVTLENNIFVDNGSTASPVSGVQVASTAAENVIRFNTFANNQASVGAARALSCGAAAVRASSNLFAGAAPLVSGCTTAYSLFPAGTTVAGTDLAGDPQFETTTLPATRDPERANFTYYHLMAGSAAVGRGEDIGAVDVDFDGDGRATMRDIGADELAN